jgi:hypothetical protein
MPIIVGFTGKPCKCNDCGGDEMRVTASAHDEHENICWDCGQPNYLIECAKCGSTNIDEGLILR